MIVSLLAACVSVAIVKTRRFFCGYCVAIVWLLCGYCVANVWLMCSSDVISKRLLFGYVGISNLGHGLLAMLRESRQRVKQW